MRKIALTSPNGIVTAMILPEYGGLLARLAVRGVETLRFQEDMTGTANVLSGGAPVLFPSPSACKNAQATYNGRVYGMPMHGFAKEMPFDVLEERPDACTLSLRSDERVMRHFYPFDFVLTLRYQVDDGGLDTVATVENLSDTPMPYALGYHPYFLATEKKACTFECNMRTYWNYLQGGAPGTQVDTIDVSEPWDHVFEGAQGAHATLVNPKDGYRAEVSSDDTYRVLTLCTTQHDAVCVEPWQAKPNAANDGTARVLLPGASETSSYRIRLTALHS